MCHLLLLLPLVGLGVFVIWPLPVALPVYLGITVISLLIYFKAHQAMQAPVMTGLEGMIGGIAEVVAEVGQIKQIRYQGELWSAVSSEELAPGDKVKIIGFEGMKIIVQKAPGETLPGGSSEKFYVK